MIIQLELDFDQDNRIKLFGEDFIIDDHFDCGFCSLAYGIPIIMNYNGNGESTISRKEYKRVKNLLDKNNDGNFLRVANDK